jgi:hypothetical protein
MTGTYPANSTGAEGAAAALAKPKKGTNRRPLCTK